jgi:hypothetical protein
MREGEPGTCGFRKPVECECWHPAVVEVRATVERGKAMRYKAIVLEWCFTRGRRGTSPLGGVYTEYASEPVISNARVK